jgi:hypothetical protein
MLSHYLPLFRHSSSAFVILALFWGSQGKGRGGTNKDHPPEDIEVTESTSKTWNWPEKLHFVWLCQSQGQVAQVLYAPKIVAWWCMACVLMFVELLRSSRWVKSTTTTHRPDEKGWVDTWCSGLVKPGSNFIQFHNFVAGLDNVKTQDPDLCSHASNRCHGICGALTGNSSKGLKAALLMTTICYTFHRFEIWPKISKDQRSQ